MTADLATRVRAVIAEQLCVPVERVVDDADLHDDLGADSLDTVTVIMGIEEEFGIEIDDDHLDALTTVADVINIVKEKAKP